MAIVCLPVPYVVVKLVVKRTLFGYPCDVGLVNRFVVLTRVMLEVQYVTTFVGHATTLKKEDKLINISINSAVP
jgi:hypothetical protein